MSLPRAAALAETPENKTLANLDSLPRNIVVVEDIPENRETLVTMLELEGHQVTAADNGQTGVELIAEAKPDFALVDCGLPVLDGYQVARKVRETPALSNTVLIALTGYGQPQDIEKALDSGFDHHMVKPVEMDDLREVLAAIKSENSR